MRWKTYSEKQSELGRDASCLIAVAAFTWIVYMVGKCVTSNGQTIQIGTIFLKIIFQTRIAINVRVVFMR